MPSKFVWLGFLMVCAGQICFDEMLGHFSGTYDLGAEIGRCITSPADFEQPYSTPRGCLYHVDMLPTRLMGNRPAFGMGSIETEVAGLYLAGSGSHAAGGVFGMPGVLAARAALSTSV